ncbi:MAG: hypothetical protein M1832_001852 [Thelocarpon impressellum]|nr:MAG: hypothetical protein M1832_001852 [Thelocarpon impressellum]
MASRPIFIDIRARSQDPDPEPASPRGLASPRMPHVDGDIPPALSPLDAFAAQGRLLARQLDDSNRDGRRVSRLPPLTIASSLAQARPGFSRSGSAEGQGSRPPTRDEPGSGTRTALEAPDPRPISVYPRLSGIPQQEADASLHLAILAAAERDRGRQPSVPGHDRPIFAARTEQSPQPAAERAGNRYSPRDGPAHVRRQRSFDSGHAPDPPQRSLTNELARSHVYSPHTLAPPGMASRRNGSSIRSVPADGSDEDNAAWHAGPTASLARKPSSGSGLSVSSPPRSPLAPPGPPRSPSIGSEYSVGGTRHARGAMNFSRPLSRASRPSLDMPSREASSEGQPYVFTDDAARTPVSLNSDETNDGVDPFQKPVPSYIYSSFSLPRGRIIQREDGDFEEGPTQERQQVRWQQPSLPHGPARPATPGTDDRPCSPTSERSPPRLQSSPERAYLTPSTSESPRSNMRELERPSTAAPAPSPPRPGHSSRPTTSSTATIRPRSSAHKPASAEISAEDHLDRGIECHEKGSVNESTYHLRIAAKMNHPTAMLLYALACRHGWGMRANAREGVQWLRKAADCAGLEVADDEKRDEGPMDVTERRTRQAQFALSIYELGVSHMNGWGIEQDKALALRCFEIAGVWGDGDALAEAGFCYAQGVGCKKDLKKAARLYRLAEAKGMSMVGNSWIYKAKYMDDDDRKGRGATKRDAPDKDREKKGRDKSRTRTMFARKKSVASST